MKHINISSIFRKVQFYKSKKLFHRVNLVVWTLLVAQMKAICFWIFRQKKNLWKILTFRYLNINICAKKVNIGAKKPSCCVGVMLRCASFPVVAYRFWMCPRSHSQNLCWHSSKLWLHIEKCCAVTCVVLNYSCVWL